MKYFLLIISITFCYCHSQRKLSKKEISKTLSSGRWLITQVTDNLYGDTTIYGPGPIPKTGLTQCNFRDLGLFNVALKFQVKDSTFYEVSIWYHSSDSSITKKPDKYSRKWFTNKGMLTIITPQKNIDNNNKPILYGQFSVLTCTDSIVILRRNLDKNKWTRTFILER